MLSMRPIPPNVLPSTRADKVAITTPPTGNGDVPQLTSTPDAAGETRTNGSTGSLLPLVQPDSGSVARKPDLPPPPQAPSNPSPFVYFAENSTTDPINLTSAFISFAGDDGLDATEMEKWATEAANTGSAALVQALQTNFAELADADGKLSILGLAEIASAVQDNTLDPTSNQPRPGIRLTQDDITAYMTNGTPPADAPPAGGTPVGGTPVGGTPVKSDPPVGGTPVGGTPVGGTPVDGTPVTRAPVTVAEPTIPKE